MHAFECLLIHHSCPAMILMQDLAASFKFNKDKRERDFSRIRVGIDLKQHPYDHSKHYFALFPSGL